MRTLHGTGLENLLINALVKELDIKGTLHVLRHGFKFYGKTFRLAHFKPAHTLNDEVLALYAAKQANSHAASALPSQQTRYRRSTVRTKRATRGDLRTEESRHRPKLATSRAAIPSRPRPPRTAIPLQDAGTGAFRRRPRRNTHDHPPQQRGHPLPPLQPRAATPGQVQCGAGNPQHASGYRTGYFWQEVLERDSFLDILGHFMFVEQQEEKGHARRSVHETMIFPRYHQLDSVRQLVAAARQTGLAKITWCNIPPAAARPTASHGLPTASPACTTAQTAKIFDCVVVITDRRVLDQQLQDAIYQIEHAQGVVKAIDQDSQQLANALIDGTKIVVTTLQKFPFVLRGLLRTAGPSRRRPPLPRSKRRPRLGKRKSASVGMP